MDIGIVSLFYEGACTISENRNASVTSVLFWVVQNFRAFSRPLNTILEGNAFNNFNLKWPQLSKTVWNLKNGQGLVFWATLKDML